MFSPSKFQQAIFNFVQNALGNAVINAVAGSGKTTTIVKALELIPTNKSVAFLAFNKAIVTELRERVPSHVNVQTMHSLGWSAIIKSMTVKPVLNNKKVFNILKTLSATWAVEDGVLELEADYIARVKKIVDLAKNNLCSQLDQLEILVERHDIEITNGECGRALVALKASYNDRTSFDFCDMLFIAAADPKIKMPTFDFIFVDECQDLNKAQQALLKKIMHADSRFIAVGDPQQAIYGFTGSDTESFRSLLSFPNTIELPLSVNYRCGKNIVKLAQAIVPQLQAHEGATEGEYDCNASYKTIKSGDMVLCRNTAPLVKMCLEFIGRGEKAFVKGGDVGANLINLVKKAKSDKIPVMFNFLDKELGKIVKKMESKGMSKTDIEESAAFVNMTEKITVLQIISQDDAVDNCGDLIALITLIFSDEKAGICLSTIHKSKGLEAENVYIIDRQLLPSKYAKKEWQQEQESNLEYVAYTRAKNYLGIVTDWTFYKKSA